MRLQHATTADSMASILKRGLLTSRSQGRRKVVWLHAPSLGHWAVTHTVKRHGGRVEDVVLMEVSVPRSWCKRHCGRHVKRGLWYCEHDIPPQRLGRVIGFQEYSASPVEE